MKYRLRELLPAGYKVLRGSDDVTVSGIEESSSAPMKGRVFVCVKGLSADGHDFAAKAAAAGAAAIVAEHKVEGTGKTPVIIVKNGRQALFEMAARYYGAARDMVKVTGVTGTKGKTTVTWLIDAMLEAGFKRKNSVIGTVAYKIGSRVHPSTNTTPSNLAINRMIGESAAKGVRELVMEVSSHALHQGRVSNITFERGVLTNVTRDHFDYHKTFVNYLNAKLMMIDRIKKSGALVVNLDDAHAQKAVKKAKKHGRKVITFSAHKKADIRLVHADMGVHGASFTLIVRGKKIRMTTHLVGMHNIYNVMAAIGAVLGRVPLSAIKRAVEKFRTVKGRLERVYHGSFTVLVDYAHTPDSMEKAIEAVRELPHNRIITVFGAGGNRDRGKRPLMGAMAEKLSGKIIVTTDNPRFEEPEAIIKDILEGIKDRNKAIVEPDRHRAILAAVMEAQKGDVIMLLGKGHEIYQDVKGKKTHFDDAEEALKAIRKAGKK